MKKRQCCSSSSTNSDKQILKNYLAISLLRITGKIIERSLYDIMFECFTESKLISDNQSGLKPDNPCIN